MVTLTLDGFWDHFDHGTDLLKVEDDSTGSGSIVTLFDAETDGTSTFPTQYMIGAILTIDGIDYEVLEGRGDTSLSIAAAADGTKATVTTSGGENAAAAWSLRTTKTINVAQTSDSAGTITVDNSTPGTATLTLSGTPAKDEQWTVHVTEAGSIAVDNSTPGTATLSLSGVALADQQWKVEIAETLPAATHTVASGNELTNVATGLADELNAVDGYSANAAGEVVTITSDDASETIAITPTAGAGGNINVDNTTAGTATLTLSGTPTVGEQWTAEITRTLPAATHTVASGDDLVGVAIGLADQLDTFTGYSALVDPVITLTYDENEPIDIVATAELPQVRYQVVSTDNVSDIATALAAGLGAVDGYSANAVGDVVTITSVDVNESIALSVTAGTAGNIAVDNSTPGTATLTLSGTPAKNEYWTVQVTGSGSIAVDNSTDGEATLSLSGAVLADQQWKVGITEILGVATHTVDTEDDLASIAAGLADELDALADYSATAAVVTLSYDVSKPIAILPTAGAMGNIAVDKTTDGQALLILSGTPVVDEHWKVEIRETQPRSHTHRRCRDDLASIAAGLAVELDGRPDYSSTSRTVVTVDFDPSITVDFETSVKTGGSIDVDQPVAGVAQLTLSGPVRKDQLWSVTMNPVLPESKYRVPKPTLADVATGLAAGLDDFVGYSASAREKVITITADDPNETIAVFSTPGTGAAGKIAVGNNTAGTATLTLSADGDQAVVGEEWSVTISQVLTLLQRMPDTELALRGQTDITQSAADTAMLVWPSESIEHNVAGVDDLAGVAAGLADGLDALAGYQAIADGEVVTVTSDNPSETILLSVTSGAAGNIEVDNSTVGTATLTLSGEVVAGEEWTVEITSSQFKVAGADDLSAVVAGLATGLNALDDYTAVVDPVVMLTYDAHQPINIIPTAGAAGNIEFDNSTPGTAILTLSDKVLANETWKVAIEETLPAATHTVASGDDLASVATGIAAGLEALDGYSANAVGDVVTFTSADVNETIALSVTAGTAGNIVVDDNSTPGEATLTLSGSLTDGEQWTVVITRTLPEAQHKVEVADDLITVAASLADKLDALDGYRANVPVVTINYDPQRTIEVSSVLGAAGQVDVDEHTPGIATLTFSGVVNTGEIWRLTTTLKQKLTSGLTLSDLTDLTPQTDASVEVIAETHRDGQVNPPSSTVQSVLVEATDGDYQLKIGGQPTRAIPHDATPEQFQAILDQVVNPNNSRSSTLHTPVTTFNFFGPGLEDDHGGKIVLNSDWWDSSNPGWWTNGLTSKTIAITPTAGAGGNINVNNTTAGTATLALSGTPTGGEKWQVAIGGIPNRPTYVVAAGGESLGQIATGLAAELDALDGYSATASDKEITMKRIEWPLIEVFGTTYNDGIYPVLAVDGDTLTVPPRTPLRAENIRDGEPAFIREYRDDVPRTRNLEVRQFAQTVDVAPSIMANPITVKPDGGDGFKAELAGGASWPADLTGAVLTLTNNEKTYGSDYETTYDVTRDSNSTVKITRLDSQALAPQQETYEAGKWKLRLPEIKLNNSKTYLVFLQGAFADAKIEVDSTDGLTGTVHLETHADGVNYYELGTLNVKLTPMVDVVNIQGTAAWLATNVDTGEADDRIYVSSKPAASGAKYTVVADDDLFSIAAGLAGELDALDDYSVNVVGDVVTITSDDASETIALSVTPASAGTIDVDNSTPGTATLTLSGTPAKDEQWTAVITRTLPAATHTVAGGDDLASVATGLATGLDALDDYSANVVGDVVTITSDDASETIALSVTAGAGGNIAVDNSTPGTATLTLSGSSTVGEQWTAEITRTLPAATHTVASGDNLASIAIGLADQLDTLTGYSAVVDPVITLTYDENETIDIIGTAGAGGNIAVDNSTPGTATLTLSGTAVVDDEWMVTTTSFSNGPVPSGRSWSENGSLDFVRGPLNIEAGSGDNRLLISDYDSLVRDENARITDRSIAGLAAGEITYQATTPIATHTVAGGDDLASVATGLAAGLDAVDGYSANVVGDVVTITSDDASETIALSVTAGAAGNIAVDNITPGTATLTLSGTPAKDEQWTAVITRTLPAATHTVAGGDDLASVATGLAAGLDAVDGYSANVVGDVVTITSDDASETIALSVTAGAAGNIVVDNSTPGTATVTLSGSPTVGEQWMAVITRTLPAATHTVAGGDDLAGVATGLAAGLNAVDGYSANAVGDVVTITLVDASETIALSVTAGAAGNIVVDNSTPGTATLTLSGTPAKDEQWRVAAVGTFDGGTLEIEPIVGSLFDGSRTEFKPIDSIVIWAGKHDDCITIESVLLGDRQSDPAQADLVITTLFANEGNDTVRVQATDHAEGAPAHEYLREADQRIVEAARRLVIRTGKGRDIVDAAPHDGTSGTDLALLIHTEAHSDMVKSGDGKDIITAGGGDDIVFGGGERDLIIDFGTEDTTSNDVVFGDHGLVRYEYTDTQELTIESNKQLDHPCFGQWPASLSWYKSAVELKSINTSTGSNTVDGDTVDGDTVDAGTNYDDTIYVQSGRNVIIAGQGNDVVKSFGGINTVLGDEGQVLIERDTKTTVRTQNASSGGPDTIYLVEGLNQVMGGAASDMICTVAKTGTTDFEQASCPTTSATVSYKVAAADVADVATGLAAGLDALDGYNANAVDNVVTITSVDASEMITLSVTAGAAGNIVVDNSTPGTATLTLSGTPTVGEQWTAVITRTLPAATHTVANDLASVATGLAAGLDAVDGYSANAVGDVVTITSDDASETIALSVTAGAAGNIAVDNITPGTATLTLSGTPAKDEQWTAVITRTLPAATHTVAGGDDLASVATGLATGLDALDDYSANVVGDVGNDHVGRRERDDCPVRDCRSGWEYRCG